MRYAWSFLIANNPLLLSKSPLCLQGKSKENPITLLESDKDDEDDKEEELTIVEGSPMKVLSQPKYR